LGGGGQRGVGRRKGEGGIYLEINTGAVLRG
jgi:hypothetical protein